MGGTGAITATTPHPAITGIATTRATADIGTATIAMTADTAITVEIGRTGGGTGGDRKKDRTLCPRLSPGETGKGIL